MDAWDVYEIGNNFDNNDGFRMRGHNRDLESNKGWLKEFIAFDKEIRRLNRERKYWKSQGLDKP